MVKCIKDFLMTDDEIAFKKDRTYNYRIDNGEYCFKSECSGAENHWMTPKDMIGYFEGFEKTYTLVDLEEAYQAGVYDANDGKEINFNNFLKTLNND